MSFKQLMDDVFGGKPAENQAPKPQAQQPQAPVQAHQPGVPAYGQPQGAGGSLPPPPGADPNRPGTGTEPMLAQPAPGAAPAPGPTYVAPAQAAPDPQAAPYPQAAPNPQPNHYQAAQVQGSYRQNQGGAAAAQAPSEQHSPSLGAWLLGGGMFIGALVLAVLVVSSSVNSAEARLHNPDLEAKPLVAIAQEAEVAYCTKDFKEVLERVLHSCGLSTGTERRGCKPADIKTFAAISDEDFNALFHPLQDRGGVLLFDEGEHELDEGAKKLLEQRWFDRKGARYFFVVARASKTGTPAKNRALSHRRANSVMFHLEEVSGEPKEELSKKVGLLWLGNEYAQLSEEYCAWPLSRNEGKCGDEAINRSSFVSWVDCRL